MARGKQSADKRVRLAKAAVDLAYRQGYRRTTLADIAAESGVPLGNLYYYYKTKDDIGDAILGHREGEFEALRTRLDDLPTPRARLLAFIDMTVRNAANVAERGCPMGSLCAELLKEGGQLAERSNMLMAKPMAWMELQFSALGRAEAASDLALQLQSSLQGASLMTQSFHDPSLLEREGRRLQSWIETL
ncbi:MAG TPA: TetR/AcrR family transcriptional regulator [Devosiaceae bacterium]|jgi:AcrR family transcriptional regulator|nr:TetR/AcrR family transcriptional regulator [Devosiaceae bacterium]